MVSRSPEHRWSFRRINEWLPAQIRANGLFQCHSDCQCKDERVPLRKEASHYNCKLTLSLKLLLWRFLPVYTGSSFKTCNISRGTTYSDFSFTWGMCGWQFSAQQSLNNVFRQIGCLRQIVLTMMINLIACGKTHFPHYGSVAVQMPPLEAGSPVIVLLRLWVG